MNQLDASFAIMEKILNAQNMHMHMLDKKFFKLTLETFKQSVMSNEETNKELIGKFLGLVEKIQTENQLNAFDLPDCAAEIRRLVKKKEHEKRATSEKSETKQTSTQNKQEKRQASTRTAPKSTQKYKSMPKFYFK